MLSAVLIAVQSVTLWMIGCVFFNFPTKMENFTFSHNLLNFPDMVHSLYHLVAPTGPLHKIVIP